MVQYFQSVSKDHLPVTQCWSYFRPKHKDTKIFENHLNHVMLVFIRKLSLRTLVSGVSILFQFFLWISIYRNSLCDRLGGLISLCKSESLVSISYFRFRFIVVLWFLMSVDGWAPADSVGGPFVVLNERRRVASVGSGYWHGWCGWLTFWNVCLSFTLFVLLRLAELLCLSSVIDGMGGVVMKYPILKSKYFYPIG